MARGGRPGFSANERKELWQRRREGQTIAAIAASLSRDPRNVSRFIAKHGGIPPQERTRAARALTLSDRELISRGLATGHWEGDLISGTNNSHVATLIERSTRYLMLIKGAGKSTDHVVPELARHVRRLPAELRKSLTWDRGMEMARHKDFTMATKVAVFFCDPRSPWQRGSNENTNGLLRQYFPDGTDLSKISQAELDRIARQMNERPRATLGFRTPAVTLSQLLH